ncbi:hypothetical protein [Tabrizicola caldifontis]|nr:hypothetical protein [Rhodobacter sp. YIM 73028]
MTINLWALILGAASGLAGVIGSRYGHKLVMGAVSGAVAAVVLTFARGYF